MKQLLMLLTVTTLISLTSIQAADAPKDFKVGEFNFKTPPDWDFLPTTSMMRKAQLRFPSGKPDQAEVIFFHFGVGDGGGVQANLDRWIGMFQEPKDKLNAKIEQKTVNGHKVHFVQAQGTFMSGMPGGPKTAQPGTMLQGAIIESPEGAVFIRCTGPVATVKAGQEAFRSMVEGAVR